MSLFRLSIFFLMFILVNCVFLEAFSFHYKFFYIPWEVCGSLIVFHVKNSLGALPVNQTLYFITNYKCAYICKCINYASFIIICTYFHILETHRELPDGVVA